VNPWELAFGGTLVAARANVAEVLTPAVSLFGRGCRQRVAARSGGPLAIQSQFRWPGSISPTRTLRGTTSAW
jgi:hypothetical protein